MDASTITPMAMAMPPSDMMFDVMSNIFMQMNAMSTATGISMMTRMTLRMCNRKMSTMMLTTTASSISAPLSVSTDATMMSLRSYAGFISTP